jgi:hypothetical protein
VASEESFARVERELMQERAAALARISGRLGELVARLAELRSRWKLLPEGDRPDSLSAFRLLRDEARLYRWYLEVQRDALGLRRHDELDELFPIPKSLDG